MPAVILQRYLLVAQSGLNNIGASGTSSWSVNSATVPLSGAWTVRCRHAECVIAPQDASGQLQLQTATISYVFRDNNANNIFSMTGPPETWVTPNFQFPLASTNITTSWDFNQTISSLDVVGAAISGVICQAIVVVKNGDSTNPHGIITFVRGIIEFENPGTNE